MNIEKELIAILEEYDEWRGNAGCNDRIWAYCPETWEFLQFVAAYGVRKNLWDADCTPRLMNNNTEIIWYDWAVSSYIKKALENGDLRLS